MFICSGCHGKTECTNRIHFMLAVSYGMCEVCNVTKVCADCHTY